ncbi:HAMP domain-containing sensor histidine kinase [Planococcus sp. N028]|uniref:histidine kinase n=1 Tax=Planococcus shixiaomingii TaxID=3058393 RepID=A0ABT8N128_9BACL|nr:HAMP domain-containing sensor histidine kinase [Planococcus sp. N028]MDN7241590.1 HAMP domain-containing sensor histidine kinase [Planococcus sp. N028]
MMPGMINNIFFIIFPIIVYQLLVVAGKRNFFASHRITLTVLFSISIVLCMSFPYQFISEDYIFDLRQVPMIVGGLYGGPYVSAALFVVAATCRILIGGEGTDIAVLNQLLVAIVVPFLRPAFLRMRWTAKIFCVFLISFFSLTFNLLVGYFLFDHPISHLYEVWLPLMVNQGAVSALAALLIEHIQRQEYMLNSLLKHEKMDTVSHFAAAVSHELRNPIQSVKGFIQLMQTYDYSREKQLEFHDIIIKEIQAAETLIEDYLVYAKPAYGQVEILSVMPEIKHILKIVGPYAVSNDIRIVLKKMNKEAFIMADRQKFHQALINIIRNGIEAMPDGGQFSIEAKLNNSKVIIELSDEGCGMTKEEVQRLGEPYFSTKIKGTGLGMMVTYSVIRQMKGDIQVESESGKGTVFTLVFPLAGQSAPIVK